MSDPIKSDASGGVAAPAASRSPFESGTGLVGATRPGQRVIAENARWLPPGSVVRLDDGGSLIHLHDDFWLWYNGCAYCYDSLERHLHRLPGVLCHIPVSEKTPQPAVKEKSSSELEMPAPVGRRRLVRHGRDRWFWAYFKDAEEWIGPFKTIDAAIEDAQTYRSVEWYPGPPAGPVYVGLGRRTTAAERKEWGVDFTHEIDPDKVLTILLPDNQNQSPR